MVHEKQKYLAVYEMCENPEDIREMVPNGIPIGGTLRRENVYQMMTAQNEGHARQIAKIIAKEFIDRGRVELKGLYKLTEVKLG